MRLLHISDLHIGKQVNEFPMLDDQRFMLERILDIIRTRKIDALLIAGDIYDRSAPSADAVACVDWFLSAVAKTGAACIAIPGNHDSAERVAYASGLLAKTASILRRHTTAKLRTSASKTSTAPSYSGFSPS